MKNNFTNELMLSLIKIFATGTVLFLVFYGSFQTFTKWEMYKNLPPTPFVDDGVCNVAVVPLSGTIGIGATQAYVEASGNTVTTIPLSGDVDRVIRDLEYVKNLPGVEAVVLQIDSYGGVGNADEILLAYLDKYPKLVVSLIRDSGTSMGYSSALSSKRIFAYPGASIGSIGVNSSFISNAEKNKKEGLEYISIISGKYKDTGTADRKPTTDELQYLQELNDKSNMRFVSTVSRYRNIPLEQVQGLADGRIWDSLEAKELGLVDEVGNLDSALSWIRNSWKVEGKQAIACPQY